MTEEEARGWVEAQFGAAAVERIASFLSLLRAEALQQNLIAPSTIDQLWSRHVVDSAQLLKWDKPGLWVDIGTGGGFPGVIVAVLRSEPVLLVEPRRRRAEFLKQAADSLGLAQVTVKAGKAESLTVSAAIISARAVASIEKLLQIGAGCANAATRWLLPRGRIDRGDLALLERSWHGVFHVEQSLTDPFSSILILEPRA